MKLNRVFRLLFAAALSAALIGGSSVTDVAAEANSVTTDMPAVDDPVRYAREPVSKVQADLGHGTKYLSDFGVTRQAVIDELSAHEDDNFYLDTPYGGGDYQSPNGDTSYNGKAAMNCGGFVSYVLRKAGLDTTKAMNAIKSTGDPVYWGSGKQYDLLSGASNYYLFAKAAGLTCYVYGTEQEMAKDRKLEKGDIVLMYWNMHPFNDGADNHIGIFWSDYPQGEVLWHSAPEANNHIGAMPGFMSNYWTYIVIKLEPMKDEERPAEPHEPSAADFSDVSPDAWYYDAVDYAAKEKLFAGMGDGTFGPEISMTRGMFVTVLGRKAGASKEKPAKTSFIDVKPDDWFAPYVEWAAKYKIVSGTGDGKYSPYDTISREQMAAILYRYAKLTGAGEIQNGTEILKFPDTGDVADYAKEAMTWAVDKGIIHGMDGKLNPRGTATRAQVAQVFRSARNVLVNTEINTEATTVPAST